MVWRVPKGGLEPPHPFEYNALNVACLPVSPLRQIFLVPSERSLYYSISTNLSRGFLAICWGFISPPWFPLKLYYSCYNNNMSRYWSLCGLHCSSSSGGKTCKLY